jgi:hypothetical protein
LRVFPDENEAVFGCSKAAAENVIESIEVTTSLTSGNQNGAYFIEKLFESSEGSAVDLIDIFGRH